MDTNTDAVAFDAAELLKGTVDAISARLGTLSIRELEALYQVEEAGQNRSTLLRAINSAIDAIDAGDDETPADDVQPVVQADPNESGDAEGQDPTEIDAQPSESAQAAPVADLKAELDRASDRAATATLERDRALAEVAKAKTRIAELEKQLKAAKAAKPKGVRTGKPITIVPRAPGELSGINALIVANRIEVQFADADDEPIDELPRLTFRHDQFDARGARALILTAPIDMPVDIGETQVSAAFLIVDDVPVARAGLVAPFAVGGGRMSRLQSGTLLFS